MGNQTKKDQNFFPFQVELNIQPDDSQKLQRFVQAAIERDSVLPLSTYAGRGMEKADAEKLLEHLSLNTQDGHVTVTNTQLRQLHDVVEYLSLSKTYIEEHLDQAEYTKMNEALGRIHNQAFGIEEGPY